MGAYSVLDLVTQVAVLLPTLEQALEHLCVSAYPFILSMVPPLLSPPVSGSDQGGSLMD